MSSNCLYGAMEDNFYYGECTQDGIISMEQIKESAGWSNFSNLFFHPDGDLCGVQDYFVKAQPPNHDNFPPSWYWVTSAKVISKRGWNDFTFLFFDPDGLKLYGVKDDQLYAGALPSNPQDKWLDHAKVVGASGWSSFDFLFFDRIGILYGVENGKLHKRSPPTDTSDDWLGTSTIFGTKGWSDFKFLFFMSNGELYGVYRDNLYKGASPTQGMSREEWLCSSKQPIFKFDGNNLKFLMSPLPSIGHEKQTTTQEHVH